MAKKSPVVPLLLLAAAGGGAYYAYKHGMLDKLLHHQEHEAVVDLRLRFLGFVSDVNGSVMANIEATNPSSVPLQVQSIVGNVMVGGKTAGVIQMFGDTVIRPADQSTIPLAVRVMPAAINIFRRKGNVIQFAGEININNRVLPLTMNYTLK